MLQYPLISKLGLDYYLTTFGTAVLADKLEKILDSAPVVSGWYDDGKKGEGFGTRMAGRGSHTARLILLEEIKPKDCEHEASSFVICRQPYKGLPDPEVKCDKCGAKLRAKWEVV